MEKMKYKELKELLIKASEAYYIDSNPIMSDYEFDMKLKELEQMEAEQGFRDDDSPTVKPGSDLNETNMSNAHKRRMESLENTYSIDEVEKWYDDMKKAIGEENPEVIVNPKWDGCSGALRYNESGIYKVLSRGNGDIGEDLTQNIKYCDDNIWPVKKLYGQRFLGEARGELIMTKEGFKELNKDGKYQNARNLVSGSLKLLDIYEFIPRAQYIKFYAYWLEDSDNLKYSDDLNLLKLYGFDVGPFYICNSLDEIKKAIGVIENSSFDVAIDGAVMKLNNKIYWKQLGSTAKYPRWAKAYKYKQESATTEIQKITFEVGRSGKITPLAWFSPVFIDGSTIEKATLNNAEYYKAMDVAIGDTVEVAKAAAIIPQIIDVAERPLTRQFIKFPTKCPCCGTKLVKHNEAHNDYFCDNPSCKSKIVDQIVNYTHSLEIDGFAEIIVERLHEVGLLNSITDIYKLKDHKAEIAELDRLSDKMADKLCQNIENSKTADFWRVLAGLNIPNVGPKTAKILAKQFKSMKVLESTTQAELEMVEDIAEITAKGIVNWFKNNHQIIRDLEKFGVNLSIEEKTLDDKPEIDLEGKTFCITGALSLPRNKYTELIESLGGKVVGAVSTKTSYLITNDKTTGTTKNIKAKQLGIPILDEKELLEMCGALGLLKELS